MERVFSTVFKEIYDENIDVRACKFVNTTAYTFQIDVSGVLLFAVKFEKIYRGVLRLEDDLRSELSAGMSLHVMHMKFMMWPQRLEQLLMLSERGKHLKIEDISVKKFLEAKAAVAGVSFYKCKVIKETLTTSEPEVETGVLNRFKTLYSVPRLRPAKEIMNSIAVYEKDEAVKAEKVRCSKLKKFLKSKFGVENGQSIRKKSEVPFQSTPKTPKSFFDSKAALSSGIVIFYFYDKLLHLVF